MSMTSAQRLYLFIDHYDKRAGRMVKSLWTQVCEKANWDKNDRAQRLQFFSRCLGREITSSNDIGKLDDFDAIKSECLAIIGPDDLNAQVDMANQPLIRLRYRIKKFPPKYVESLLRSPRFGKSGLADLETMSEEELTQLRDTLTARFSRKKTAKKKEERPVEQKLF